MVEDTRRETAGVTTRLIVAYVRRHLGDEGVARLLALAGETRPVEVLEDERSWSSYAAKVALFEAAEALTGDPWVARRIGEALLAEQLGGLLRVVIGALGSPQRVLQSVASANVKFSTVATMRAIETRPGRAVVGYRLEDGHTPSRHDCRYTQGVLTQVTVLFGLPPATIVHPSCQAEGADECIYEVTWPLWRSWLRRWLPGRRDGLSGELAVLRERVVDIERTVADVVSSQDLDAVLRSIAARSSAAVRAQRHLLAVELHEGGRQRVHSDGFTAKEAERLGREILAGSSAPPEGYEQLAAQVASAHRRYGWLVAYLPSGKGFLPLEAEHLHAYARLAAVALDAATALDEARRGESMSEALLTLGQELGHQHDEAAVAQRVVEAVPSVVGADRGSLLLWDAERQCLRTVAVHCFGRQREAALRLEVTTDDTPELERLLADPQPRIFTPEVDDPWIRDVLDSFDARTLVAVPVVSRGELLGVVLASWVRGGAAMPADAEVVRGLTSLAEQAGIALSGLRLLERTRHQATHDTLTGLAGRALFHDRVEQALAASRRSGRTAAVCFIDLDCFKAVNDHLGHAAGDKLLVQVADRIRATLRDSDSAARMAGDEFAVLLRDLADPGDASTVAAGLVAVLVRPYNIDGVTVEVGASIGVALGPGHGVPPNQLLQAADAAMYDAKAEGNTYRVWAPDLVRPLGRSRSLAANPGR